MNKSIGYKLNRDDGKKKAEEYYNQYVRDKWVGNLIQIDINYEEKYEEIKESLKNQFQNICKEVLLQQENNEKGSIKYIYISFLRTNVLENNSNYRVDFYDEDWFLDKVESSGNMDMSFVFSYLYKFIDDLKEEIQKNKIKLSEVEIEKIKLDDSEKYNILAIEYLKSLIEDIIDGDYYKKLNKSDKIYIMSGEYMDNSTLLYPINQEEENN